jgi:hypothetical protein
MLYNEMLGTVSVKLGIPYITYWAVNGQCEKKKKNWAPNVTLASMWKKSKVKVT